MSPSVVEPDRAIQKCPQLVPGGLGFAGGQIALEVALLPLYVLKIKIDEAGPYLHRFIP